MKIKLDYVTNSSSASIYLIIKSNHKNVEEFTEAFNRYMKEYVEGRWGTQDHPHFWDGTEIEKKSGLFYVKSWTSMFNYAIDDIPRYMQALYLHWLVNPEDVERQFGFSKIKIKVEDEY